MFAPLTRETLSGQIRDRLLARITSGELEPGTQDAVRAPPVRAVRRGADLGP